MSNWQDVGDGIFVRRYEWLALTIGAVLGDDGVLLVDTRASHRQAEELIDDLTAVTHLPVRWVVNTHYHWDHCWGNALFPQAQVWGHENARRQLLRHGEETRAMVLSHLPPEEHEAFEEVAISPPDHTFSDRVSLDIGRAVILRHHGRGHTDSDISISVGNVLFAGDLVEQAAPPAFGDSFPLEWTGALDDLLGYVEGPVVPGHGAPVDRTYVEGQKRDIFTTVEIVRASYDGGTPIDEIDLRAAAFPMEVSRAVAERTYAQLAGDI
jgi:glyoxylase-like metal-dependent hydrolase (beta-lactamase superfamily II)